jgi:hypothetical protein
MLESGGGFKTEVSISVYGLTQSQMNQLSTYGAPPNIANPNIVTVSAGDAGSALSILFKGNLVTAYADYSGQPEAKFVVESVAGLYLASAPADPLSYNGPASVDTIMGNIATQMGLKLENSGVTEILTNPYLPGSLDDKRKAVAQAANINSFVDIGRGVLAIWPKNISRNGEILQIGPTTGLVGFPTFTYQGVRFTCLWNPDLIYGRQIELQSSLTPASGRWVPTTIHTDLATEVPNGPWFNHVEAFIPARIVGGGL